MRAGTTEAETTASGMATGSAVGVTWAVLAIAGLAAVGLAAGRALRLASGQEAALAAALVALAISGRRGWRLAGFGLLGAACLLAWVAAGTPLAEGAWLSASPPVVVGLVVAAALAAVILLGGPRAALHGRLAPGMLVLGFWVLALVAVPGILAWIGLSGMALVGAGRRRGTALLHVSVGLGLALFGMALGTRAGHLFLVIGLGGLGLVPLSRPWRAIHRSPARTLAAGLLPLAAILRLHWLMPGGSMALAGFGLAVLLAAAAQAWRANGATGRLGAASAAWNAAALFGFGLGGTMAGLGGLLILAGAGPIGAALAPAPEDGAVSRVHGLGVAALAGLPPFAPFAGLLLVVLAAAARDTALVLPLALGTGFTAALLWCHRGGETGPGRRVTGIALGVALAFALAAGLLAAFLSPNVTAVLAGGAG